MEQIDLMQGEEILVKTRRSWVALVPSIFISILIFGCAVGIGYGVSALRAYIVNLISEGHETSQVTLTSDTFGKVLVYGGYALGSFFGILVFIMRIIAIKFDYLILTNKRLYGRKGFIAKSIFDTVLSKIDTVRVNNTIFGKLFHYASIEIVSPASSKIVNGNTVNEEFDLICNTEEFRKAVLAALERENEQQASQKDN